MAILLRIQGARASDAVAEAVLIAEQQATLAEMLLLPWPRPLRRVGRPTRQAQYHDVLYAALQAKDFGLVSKWATTEVPVWFKKGMSLQDVRQRWEELERIGVQLAEDPNFRDQPG